MTADATTSIDDVAPATASPKRLFAAAVCRLLNPYLDLADNTFGTGCGTHVWSHECDWSETAENLQVDMDRLRAEKPESRPGLLTGLLIALRKRWS